MTETGYKPVDIFEGLLFILIYVFMVILIPASCIVGLAFLIGVI